MIMTGKMFKECRYLRGLCPGPTCQTWKVYFMTLWGLHRVLRCLFMDSRGPHWLDCRSDIISVEDRCFSSPNEGNDECHDRCLTKHFWKPCLPFHDEVTCVGGIHLWRTQRLDKYGKVKSLLWALYTHLRTRSKGHWVDYSTLHDRGFAS